ncbi:LmbE family protein [Thermaerobacter marianensis DSM 12885]|uniref:LmbE family protein n=1 Tax=Thermaerobacter marianensis (strain ATCC 700841 / DSM 12885 / JCM 10246 / 7p75a) TaxID=644966 RepID=E6SMD4_THEM7|nr:PIG-L family deacetylase [Thermaerobacter marianensis]ADU51493.1 LmbE family protein [Thermaerobacter marianensis DSM 12885]
MPEPGGGAEAGAGRRRRLLCLTAHPDDESFSPGASLARYASEGVEVTVVCATRGQAGKPGDPPLCSRQELPQVREAELRAACRELGVARVYVLDYEDGRLDRIPAGHLEADLAGWMERVDPDVVLTFPPGGISGHRDHQVLSRAVERAFHQVLAPAGRARLYYFTLPAAVYRLNGLGAPPHPLDAAVTTVVDARPWAGRKRAALARHRTQHRSVERAFGGFPPPPSPRLGWEFFYRAWPALPPGLPPHPRAVAAAAEAPAEVREAVARAVEFGLFGGAADRPDQGGVAGSDRAAARTAANEGSGAGSS